MCWQQGSHSDASLFQVRIFWHNVSGVSAPSSPIGRNGRVGDHDGLQVKAPIGHKHNGVRILLQHWGRAPKHLACNPSQTDRLNENVFCVLTPFNHTTSAPHAPKHNPFKSRLKLSTCKTSSRKGPCRAITLQVDPCS